VTSLPTLSEMEKENEEKKNERETQTHINTHHRITL